MHQTPWSPERPLPPPVSLTSQSHHEKPPEVTCTRRGKPGFPASTRERPQILGQTLFMLDILVLTLSLSYIDIQHMMYTVIASFVFSQVVAVVQNGGYTVRGMLIISEHHELIASKIMAEVDRGATYLKAEGVYSGQDKKVIYVVLSPTQVLAVKAILSEIDPDAFVSIINGPRRLASVSTAP